MNAQLHEFATESDATREHAELRRLGFHPHSIFRTARGTWAFWSR